MLGFSHQTTVMSVRHTESATSGALHGAFARELPAPPSFDRWPQAVRSAELLRGTLVRCGPGYRTTGWPESPRVRISALGEWLSQGEIVMAQTAAWVWGVARTPGAPLKFSTKAGTRCPNFFAADRDIREFTFTKDEVVAFGPHTVTSPIRTAFDLLHQKPAFTTQDAVSCRLLLLYSPDGMHELARMLASRTYGNRAAARIRFAHLQRA